MKDENGLYRGLCDPDHWTFVGSLLIAIGGCAVSVGNLLRLNASGRLSEHTISPTAFTETKPAASPGEPNARARNYFSL